MDDARFAELAVLKGYVTSQQVRRAVSEGKKQPGQARNLAHVMVGLGMLSAEHADGIFRSEGESYRAAAPPGQAPGVRPGGAAFPSVEGYKLVEKVSSSREGNVYKAVQLSMQRTVLLKVLEGEEAGDETAVRRFLAEARAAGRLNHPNVIRVHEVGRSEGLYFYTTEFVEGHTLEETLKEDLPASRAAEICAQVADALDYASRMEVTHGELTPSAIVISAEDQAKVSGLGLTRPSSTRFLLGDNAQYVAPELVRGNPPDARSDIYSLGCILFRSTTGRAPFPGRTPREVLASHASASVPDPHASDPQLPKDLGSIVARTMAKDPSARYASAMEMASALRELKFEKRPKLRRRRRRRRRR